jgi:anion-transporting  ArsA/GET3 family ATPase
VSRPLWEGRQVVVCVGTGGVGKTTVSATLATAAAAEGLRTLVMTIDPARRLAQALGVSGLDDREHPIDPALLAEHGLTLDGGTLAAMMPDVKRTFDGLVERWAPTPEAARKILDNRIYQHFSTALAGSDEYAAVEKLYEVYSSGRYDLIVLDTPPSQNAVDFLEAPGRILDFLDSDTLGWLAKPGLLAGKVSLKLLDFGGSLLFRTVGKLTGAETLRELMEFLLSFQGMYDGFRERSRKVKALLRSDALAFVLVSAPSPGQLRGMGRFRDELAASGLDVRGVVLNRVRQPFCAPEALQTLRGPLRSALAGLPPAAAAAAESAVLEEAALAGRDTAALAGLRERLAPLPVVGLPELPADLHDLAALARLAPAFR